jgi:hypothetical protein
MTSLVFSTIAVTIALSQSVPAPKPDFSGTWSKDRSRSQSTEAITLDIKQTAAEIRISTTRAGGQPTVTTFPIGTPPSSTSGIDPERPRAYWDGTKLVTENAGNVSGQTVSVKETRSFNAAGEMVIESLVIVQHGYSITGSKNYGSGTDVYVKAKRP